MILYVIAPPRAGKTSITVQKAIEEYASKGRRVAANFPIDLAPVCKNPGTKLSQAVISVIPDRPTVEDLDSLGKGGPSEQDCGLLIVDEAGTWLNTREWNQPDRLKIINWITQSGKRYWDVFVIAHSLSMIDKQLRECSTELVCRVRRIDRAKIMGVNLPRAHRAVVRSGPGPNDPVTEKWLYRASEAHKCYDSYREFGLTPTYRHSMLPAMQTKFRNLPPPKTLADVRTWLNRAPVVLFALLCVTLGLATRDEMFHRARVVPDRPEAGTVGLSDYKQVVSPLVV